MKSLRTLSALAPRAAGAGLSPHPPHAHPPSPALGSAAEKGWNVRTGKEVRSAGTACDGHRGSKTVSGASAAGSPAGAQTNRSVPRTRPASPGGLHDRAHRGHRQSPPRPPRQAPPSCLALPGVPPPAASQRAEPRRAARSPLPARAPPLSCLAALGYPGRAPPLRRHPARPHEFGRHVRAAEPGTSAATGSEAAALRGGGSDALGGRRGQAQAIGARAAGLGGACVRWRRRAPGLRALERRLQVALPSRGPGEWAARPDRAEAAFLMAAVRARVAASARGLGPWGQDFGAWPDRAGALPARCAADMLGLLSSPVQSFVRFAR